MGGVHQAAGHLRQDVVLALGGRFHDLQHLGQDVGLRPDPLAGQVFLALPGQARHEMRAGGAPGPLRVPAAGDDRPQERVQRLQGQQHQLAVPAAHAGEGDVGDHVDGGEQLALPGGLQPAPLQGLQVVDPLGGEHGDEVARAQEPADSVQERQGPQHHHQVDQGEAAHQQAVEQVPGGDEVQRQADDVAQQQEREHGHDQRVPDVDRHQHGRVQVRGQRHDEGDAGQHHRHELVQGPAGHRQRERIHVLVDPEGRQQARQRQRSQQGRGGDQGRGARAGRGPEQPFFHDV